MSANLSIVELATQVQEQVKTLSSRLDALKAPQPSYAFDGPANYPEDPEVGLARLQLLDLTYHLRQLVFGPEDFLKWEKFTWTHDAMTTYAFSKLKIFQAVPADGSEISYKDIAAKTGVPESYIFRLIRYGRGNNFFRETRPGYVAHTAFSIAPVHDPRSMGFIEHNFEDITFSSTREVEAIQKFGESEEPNASGLGLAYDLKPGQNCFDLWNTIEGGRRVERFGDAMAFLSSGGPHRGVHLYRGFDWDSLGEAVVVDLGGSTGHVSFGLAKNHPKLKLIVQDLPGLEKKFDAAVPDELKTRVSFQAHDFFTPQPVQAEVFFMKHILHDWSDKYATKIIHNLIPALRDGNRVVLQEAVLPPHGTALHPIQKLGYGSDMQMMVAANSKERTKEDWISLFERADDRFEIKAFTQPPGSASTIIEIVFHAK